MKHCIFTIRENTMIAPDVYHLRLDGDASAFTAPGQFLNIKLEGFFLRRPISVLDWDDTGVSVIYRILGRGTDALSKLAAGTKLDVLTGLGNGFDLRQAGHAPLLVGGGVGLPPLYRLAREFTEAGVHTAALFGFRSREDIILADAFRELGTEVTVTTADGSTGIKGMVTDALPLPGSYSYVYACGPSAMLRALSGVISEDAQFSLEERMGCGFGACMGCTIVTASGPKRVCRDGPVFKRKELLW